MDELQILMSDRTQENRITLVSIEQCLYRILDMQQNLEVDADHDEGGERNVLYKRIQKYLGWYLIFEFVKMKDGAYQTEHFNRFAVAYSSQ